MKVLVIHGSMRKNGNTGILADEFIRGAQKPAKPWMKSCGKMCITQAAWPIMKCVPLRLR